MLTRLNRSCDGSVFTLHPLLPVGVAAQLHTDRLTLKAGPWRLTSVVDALCTIQPWWLTPAPQSSWTNAPPKLRRPGAAPVRSSLQRTSHGVDMMCIDIDMQAGQ